MACRSLRPVLTGRHTMHIVHVLGRVTLISLPDLEAHELLISCAIPTSNPTRAVRPRPCTLPFRARQRIRPGAARPSTPAGAAYPDRAFQRLPHACMMSLS